MRSEADPPASPAKAKRTVADREREAPPAPAEKPFRIWVSDPNVGADAQGIDGFYRTREAAIRGVKERFPDPYKVTWTIESRAGDALVLRGAFEHVAGYCTAHVAEWFILPATVEP